MKRSVQREAILDELRSLKCHPTAEELYQRLKQSMPNLSIATVYRNLEQFSKAGLVLKLDCGGELKRFDGNVNIHPHLRCTDCGAVSDMDNRKLSELQNELINMLPELDCRSLRLEFCGRCSRCQKNQQEEMSL